MEHYIPLLITLIGTGLFYLYWLGGEQFDKTFDTLEKLDRAAQKEVESRKERDKIVSRNIQ